MLHGCTLLLFSYVIFFNVLSSYDLHFSLLFSFFFYPLLLSLLWISPTPLYLSTALTPSPYFHHFSSPSIPFKSLILCHSLAGEEGDIDGAQELMTKLERLQAEKEQIVVRTLHPLLHYTTLYCITCIALHCSTVHCAALMKEKHTAPHYTTLYYTTPHDVSTFIK